MLREDFTAADFSFLSASLFLFFFTTAIGSLPTEIYLWLKETAIVYLSFFILARPFSSMLCKITVSEINYNSLSLVFSILCN